MKKIIISFTVIFAMMAVAFVSHFVVRTPNIIKAEKVESKEDTKDIEQDEHDVIEELEADYGHEIEEEASADPDANIIKTVTNPNSIAVLVNRRHLLPEDYEPKDLVVPDVKFSFYGTYERSYMREIAAFYLERLFEAAEKHNVILKGVSGYRSYERQQAIYENNVRNRGKKETNAVSAKPGSSEHQTGLTIDVSSDSAGVSLGESFGYTTEGIWLARNAHKYGYIVRYPKGKEKITGYDYEPWHIRYVGRSLATYLYEKKYTLEEYYRYTTVDEKINTKADIIRYRKQKKKQERKDALNSESPSPSPSASSKSSPSSSPKKTTAPKNSPKATAEIKTTKTPKPSATVTPKASPSPSAKAKQSTAPKDEDETTETTDETVD
ncbi:MAG: M15 family metallopeptidase [Lachnospiraceae bacterium]|nr:M15 family metallopeptidase [Lachnospiraceae bacterium]